MVPCSNHSHCCSYSVSLYLLLHMLSEHPNQERHSSLVNLLWNTSSCMSCHDSGWFDHYHDCDCGLLETAQPKTNQASGYLMPASPDLPCAPATTSAGNKFQLHTRALTVTSMNISVCRLSAHEQCGIGGWCLILIHRASILSQMVWSTRRRTGSSVTAMTDSSTLRGAMASNLQVRLRSLRSSLVSN